MFYGYLGVHPRRAESLLCAVFAFVGVHIRQTVSPLFSKCFFINLLQSHLFPQGDISKHHLQHVTNKP